MRPTILGLFFLSVAPLHSQNQFPPPPIDIAASFQAPPQIPAPLVGNSPLVLLPQRPDNYGQAQAAIEKAMAGTKTVVSMDLDSVLLKSAANSITVAEDIGGAVRKLLRGLTSVQLRMFDAADSKARAQMIRNALKDPQWKRAATFSSEGSEIEMWSGRWGNTMTGVLLLTVNGQRVFAMNVDGDIRPDQLMSLFGLLGIPDFQPKIDIKLDPPAAAK